MQLDHLLFARFLVAVAESVVAPLVRCPRAGSEVVSDVLNEKSESEVMGLGTSQTPLMRITRSGILSWLLLIGILFNNIVRWFPFPAGRSLNDMSTLEENIVGIVVNLLLYCFVLVLVASRKPWAGAYLPHSGLIDAYCIYILIQSVFRSTVLIEFGRGLAAAAMFISADRAGKYLGNNLARLRRVMVAMWAGLVLSLMLGIVIGLINTEAVNWGSGLSRSFAQHNRAEFFFFYVPPSLTFALSLFVIKWKQGYGPLAYALAAFAVVGIPVLVLRTASRSLVFGLIVVMAVFLYRLLGRGFILMVVILGLVLVGFPEAAGEYAMNALLLGRDPTEDWSGGRLALNIINLEMFLQAPLFGWGAEAAKRVIEMASPVAKTEHGYSVHLASYGLFALLFFMYVAVALGFSLKMIWQRFRDEGPLELIDGISFVASSMTVGVVFLGVFGVFGSATAYYDWMAVLFLSLSYALGTRYFSRGWVRRTKP